jgi:hypothetical protein
MAAVQSFGRLIIGEMPPGDCQIFCVKGLLIVFLEKKNIKWGKA